MVKTIQLFVQILELQKQADSCELHVYGKTLLFVG